ncbi:MAG TPA: hypothetical protein VFO15_18080 [Xanthobacteraceae bacterium]|nr:hypothetical protein [Xanthobacteraceae bacterium]
MNQARLATHSARYSRTNSHGVVAVCHCGWIGAVHPAHRAISKSEAKGRWLWELAEQAAEAEHAEHVKRDGPLTYTMPPEQFVGAVINTKRFGHA